MSVFIVKRAVSAGVRYHVRWQQHRSAPQVHLGAFGTLEEAEARKRAALVFVAQGRFPSLVDLSPRVRPKRKKTQRRPVSLRMRFDVLERDQFTCRYCGQSAPFVELHVDHVFPVARGGKTTLDNLVTACVDCNMGKRARTFEWSEGAPA